MTSNEMFGAASWVTPSDKCDTPFIRGYFNAEKGEKAEITVCGLGFFELFINGKRASSDLFVPADSDYHFFPEQECLTLHGEITSHRIYCLKYDITCLIEDGKNSVSVFLAPGWYKPYGDVKLCYKIELEKSDNVFSDKSLKWAKSFIEGYDFIHGEKHDYSAVSYADIWNERSFDDSNWKNVTEIPAPESEYYIQTTPADTVIRHIKPRLIGAENGSKLYDCGENITGRPIVFCDLAESQKIIVSVGEFLTPDGKLDEFYSHGQTSEFITDAKEREMSIRFCWNAFRYIRVTGNALITDCEVIHADVPVTSFFECDNENINWLYDAYIRTQLDNMHAGIPSDCPHLEKRGYTGDGQLCCSAVMTMFDAKVFYEKWMEDISDCQDKNTGHIQYTAPYVHSGGGPGGWGCAIIEVPYQFYKAYGDTAPLKKYYPQMLRYLDFLEEHSENDLVTSDMPDEWCLGEWCTPSDEMQKRPMIPQPFVNNYFYIKSLQRLEEIASLIGKKEDIKKLQAVRKIKTDALIREYYDEKSGDFCNNIQGSNSFALELGLGDERTFENLIKAYKNDLVFNTGIFGTDLVIKLLFERGCSDLALSLLASDKKPSFGYWKKRGATTLWEEWGLPRSMNHPMFGAPVKYLFTEVLGVKAESAGYKKVVISPDVGFLRFAKGFITTEYGKIEVRVNRRGEGTFVDVVIGKDVDAALKMNGVEIKLSEGKNSFAF
ncbi:MAG: glycoside hydrolase family 78 protein [Clostridiales bacterium]|nr:glycoside hydrolase family 78 protein [Clostridiales bacterium]